MKGFIVAAGVFLSLIGQSRSEGISSCSTEWMPLNNVRTNKDGIERRGYYSAVDTFCDQAHGQEVGGKLYLSMATRVWMNHGGDPKQKGIYGYVYFEIHNKQDRKHMVDGDKCKEYLKNLGRDSKCWGSEHDDTKGGTWQVGSNDVSYHAFANRAVSPQDCLDKTVVHREAIGPLENGGKGNTLDPFPTYIFNDVIPLACHSHNDYEGYDRIALYSALTAGCVSVEADVWVRGGQLEISHVPPSAGLTRGFIQDLYINPLKKLIDKNQAVFPRAPKQSLTILVDFKEDDKDKTLQLLVDSLTPLRNAGYLSTVKNGKFSQGLVTIVASGKPPLAKIEDPRTNPLGAVFADAFIDGNLNPYNAENAHYASAKGLPSPSDMKTQIEAAHKKGLKVRYYEISDDPNKWQELVNAGVDRVNVDDLTDVVAVKWNAKLL